ncbi:MAG TPA: hemolysin family protein [Acidimicrobiales bacterium]|jgi:CBS domain containing-hemolysin-like protein
MSVGAGIATVLLLLANGFFVTMEFALMTGRRTLLETMAEGGSRSAALALDAKDHVALQVAGAQLGVTMASLGLGFVTEPAVGRLVESALRSANLPGRLVTTIGIAVSLAIVVFVHMVIGETVPKNLTLANPERVATALAWPQRAYVVTFGPLIKTLSAAARLGVRAFGMQPADEGESAHSADEIGQMLATSRDEGLLDPFEHELLAGALDFEERPVASVMVPRDQVAWVQASASVEDIEALIVERGHSRLPVVGSSLDDVRGFVHAKDLLDLAPAQRSRPYPLARLRRMLIVTEQLPLGEVLVRMQARRLHLAVVVDRHGRTAGVATLEDVLESLVGEIRDESDPDPDPEGSAHR